jgi:hypothetical protein
LTQYSHPRDTKAKQGWTSMRYVPDNICTAIFNEMGSGTCGYNSYCSMENQRPTCKCPYGYSLLSVLLHYKQDFHDCSSLSSYTWLNQEHDEVPYLVYIHVIN